MGAREHNLGRDLLHFYKRAGQIKSCTLTLSYSSEINAVLCPQRVFLPLKKKRDISTGGCTAYPVRYKKLQFYVDSS